jgi:hypothetical protein
MTLEHAQQILRKTCPCDYHTGPHWLWHAQQEARRLEELARTVPLTVFGPGGGLMEQAAHRCHVLANAMIAAGMADDESLPEAIALTGLTELADYAEHVGGILHDRYEEARRNRPPEGPDQVVPMCGIPYYTLDHYLPRLIKAGHRVAVVEQKE